MYTLILTLLVVGAPSPMIATTEFKSEATCKDAGTKWALEMVKTYGAGTKMSSVCVPK
jgi:hypothetical protein